MYTELLRTLHEGLRHNSASSLFVDKTAQPRESAACISVARCDMAQLQSLGQPELRCSGHVKRSSLRHAADVRVEQADNSL